MIEICCFPPSFQGQSRVRPGKKTLRSCVELKLDSRYWFLSKRLDFWVFFLKMLLIIFHTFLNIWWINAKSFWDIKKNDFWSLLNGFALATWPDWSFGKKVHVYLRWRFTLSLVDTTSIGDTANDGILSTRPVILMTKFVQFICWKALSRCAPLHISQKLKLWFHQKLQRNRGFYGKVWSLN